MKYESEIVPTLSGLFYPFIILFGVYLLINGHTTPGGGFQGGAILSSLLIVRYLEFPDNEVPVDTLLLFEKIFLFCIVLFAAMLLLKPNGQGQALFTSTYLVIMNVLIGLKVFCGISILFVRFVFNESREAYERSLR